MRAESSRVKAAVTWVAALSFLGLVAIAALAQKSQTPDVMAILAKCQQCHGATVQMSKLSLATRASVLQGGSHGPAVIPGNAADSLLYKRITGQEKPQMPMAPVAPLTAEEIQTIKDWINLGAPFADDQRPAAPAATTDSDPSLLVYGAYHERKITDADRQWWAFRMPVRPAIPQGKDSGGNGSPIDALVRAKLDQKGLAPAPQADRRTLIRRAYLDLTGLLPSPAEVDSFVKDPSPRAYGATASLTCKEPPRPTNGWFLTRPTAASRSSALISEYPPTPAPGTPSLTPSADTVFAAPSGAPGSTIWSPTLATQAPKAAIICSRASADAGGPPPPW